MSESAGVESSTAEPRNFTVTTGDPVGGVVTVCAVGAVDLLTAPPIDQALQQAQQAVSAVLLDLRLVDFLGSAGLSVLVDAARRAGDTGGRFAVLSDQHAVLRAVEVTGLDAVLKIFTEPAEAEGYLRG